MNIAFIHKAIIKAMSCLARRSNRSRVPGVNIVFIQKAILKAISCLSRRITAYKNMEIGIKAHGSFGIVFEDVTVADSRIGVDFHLEGNETLRCGALYIFAMALGH